MIVYWEDDDTNAKDDGTIMEKLLKDVFGFASCSTFVLKTKDPILGWSLADEFRKLVAQHHNTSQHSLFVFYYAGHGALYDNEFHLANKKKRIAWSLIQSFVLEDNPITHNMDVLVVLDSCFSGKAKRADTTKNTQILAASDKITQQRHTGQISWTQHMHKAVHAIRSHSPKTMTSSSILEALRQECDREKFDPVLITDGGKLPITFTFRPSSRPSTSQSLSRVPIRAKNSSRHSVMAKITLHGEANEFASFSQMIKDLPPNMAADIVDAYKTDRSFFCLLRMEFESFALWDMVTEMEMIDHTIGDSLVKRDRHLVEGSAKKEDMPFRSK